jgi:transposase
MVAETVGTVGNFVGVDTHRDVHVAAVVDPQGRFLGSRSFPSSARGNGALEQWVGTKGRVASFGVEGTGSWGAGLARALSQQGHQVLEVDRPNRRIRRQKGKSDTIDAESAARAVLAGTATGTPETRQGPVEMIRALRVARRAAVKARSQAALQLHSLVATAPQSLRDELRTLSLRRLVETCGRFRPHSTLDVTQATKLALRSRSRRWELLDAEIWDLEQAIEPLVRATAPRLLALPGVGPEIAGQLLVTAGDNPDRLRSEAAFAHLCGVAPIPASSGKTNRHRLNRGGDRQANCALYLVAISRLRHDQRTREYAARRTQEGRSKAEIIRCLKRYVARDVYRLLVTLDTP